MTVEPRPHRQPVRESGTHWSSCDPLPHFVFKTLPPKQSASQVVLMVKQTNKQKNLPTNAGDARDMGSIPGSGRSPGGGHGNPLQYSCLENPMDRGALRATVHRVTKSQTWLKQLSMHACKSHQREFMSFEHELFILLAWSHFRQLALNTVLYFTKNRCQSFDFAAHLSNRPEFGLVTEIPISFLSSLPTQNTHLALASMQHRPSGLVLLDPKIKPYHFGARSDGSSPLLLSL